MELKITSQHKNPFLQREELLLEIKSNSTPSILELKKELGKDEARVVVRKIKSNFGTHMFNAEVFVYDSAADLKKIEVVPQKVRKKIADEAKVAHEAAKKATQETEAKTQ